MPWFVQNLLTFLRHVCAHALHVPDVFAPKGHMDVRSEHTLPLFQENRAGMPANLLEHAAEAVEGLFGPFAAGPLDARVVVCAVVVDERFVCRVRTDCSPEFMDDTGLERFVDMCIQRFAWCIDGAFGLRLGCRLLDEALQRVRLALRRAVVLECLFDEVPDSVLTEHLFQVRHERDTSARTFSQRQLGCVAEARKRQVKRA